MKILRLLAARRAASSITTRSPAASEFRDDEGPFFDLDISSCPVRASSSSSGSLFFSESDDDEDECTELDFIISLQRSHSASQLNFCASEPAARASSLQSQQHGGRKRGSLRSMSFGARKAVPLHRGGRPSFAWSSSGRHSFGSACSLRLSMDSRPHAAQDHEEHPNAGQSKRAPSIRRCLANFSRRLRTASLSPRAAKARGLHRLRKCRSASSAAPPRRVDDLAVEKQDGIAGAIAHCKDSLHRASTSQPNSPLLRSTSDPGY